VCVNPGGTHGCFSSIQAGVNAVKAGGQVDVESGTYKEDVTVSKALTLKGRGFSSTTVDATGKPHGLEVLGVNNAGVSNVNVKGFTFENAKYGGVLLHGSRIQFDHNRVRNNDKALVLTANGPDCPGIPFAFDSFDCGEGITIVGLSDSVLADNIVEGNEGGILVSDELGPTHDNTIRHNTVRNNPDDCAITMASHGADNQVFNNLVIDNIATGNGGAGVGLFAPVPRTGAHDNVVLNNTLTNNGLPGVAMHSHAADQNVNGNAVIGNTISGNGADQPLTSVPTGIVISSDPGAAPIQGTKVLLNKISNESIDIWIGTSASSADINMNDLLGGAIGVDNAGTGDINAEENFWGCDGGPGASGCSTVRGPNVHFVPFLSDPVADDQER
jgi:parallel beta-helix repeat protein